MPTWAKISSSTTADVPLNHKSCFFSLPPTIADRFFSSLSTHLPPLREDVEKSMHQMTDRRRRYDRIFWLVTYLSPCRSFDYFDHDCHRHIVTFASRWFHQDKTMMTGLVFDSWEILECPNGWHFTPDCRYTSSIYLASMSHLLDGSWWALCMRCKFGMNFRCVNKALRKIESEIIEWVMV